MYTKNVTKWNEAISKHKYIYLQNDREKQMSYLRHMLAPISKTKNIVNKNYYNCIIESTWTTT